MAKNTGTTFKVESFDGGDNFIMWQSTVKNVFVEQGLVKPLKKEGKLAAMTKIGMQSRSNVPALFESETDLWKGLENMYLGKNLTIKLELKRELHRLRMAEGGDTIEYMNMLNGLVDQLATVEVKLEEKEKALILLTSLPDSYENLVNTILHDKKTVKIEEMVLTLLSHDKRKKGGGYEDGIQALFGGGQNQKREGNKTTTTVVEVDHVLDLTQRCNVIGAMSSDVLDHN